MSLADVVPDASLERYQMHLLSPAELEPYVQQRDAEALYIQGYRLRQAVGEVKDEQEGMRLTIESALMGHPVALGSW
jgi:hypothetical protein